LPAGVFTVSSRARTLDWSWATPGAFSLVERLTDDRVRRHDDARFGPVLAGKPGARVVHDLAAFVVVDELAEVVDRAVLVLGEEVECLLDKLVVRKTLILEHQYLATCDLASLAQHGRFESCGEDFACIRSVSWPSNVFGPRVESGNSGLSMLVEKSRGLRLAEGALSLPAKPIAGAMIAADIVRAMAAASANKR